MTSMFQDAAHFGYVPEKIKQAEKMLEQNPYDVEAWGTIVREVKDKKIEEARVYYEKLVAQFPTAGRYWKLYIEHEMKSKNYERVEKLFRRCVTKILNVDLWRCYLDYVKETKGNMPSYSEKMAQAYDFVLEKIGMDFASYPIWKDYITFLRNMEAIGSYAENQRIAAVRKIYHRGVTNPMTNIEQLWKDYTAYEQSINHVIADKVVPDKSRDYMNARRVAKEYECVTRGLNKNAVSTPARGLPEEIRQVELWKKYIAWEKSNPLHTEDQSIITNRVMFAYEQCFLCLGHHPDIWYEAGSFLEQYSKLLKEKGDLDSGNKFADKVSAIYERATDSLPKYSKLLHFAYADFEEGRMKYEKVHQIYNKYIQLTDIDPTLAYIQYMKFTRRAEGLKSARAVFKKAREDTRSKHHVYVAAALMEYHHSKDKAIASRIFELGLKKHDDNPHYILEYLDYLLSLNEDDHTRAVFERVLISGRLTLEKSVEIWNKYVKFESNVGDLSSVSKIEKRRTAVIGQLKEFEGKETALLVDRYKFLDVYPCTIPELKSVGYKESELQRVTSLPPTMACKKESLLGDGTDKKTAYARPDTSQMIPFKPKRFQPNGSHPMPGGVFPAPPAAQHLMTLLPPPTCFHGPFVIVDELIKAIKNCSIPENFAPQSLENDAAKEAEKFFEHASSASSESRKRKRVSDGNHEESEDEDSGMAPPVNNIYRTRQLKKLK